MHHEHQHPRNTHPLADESSQVRPPVTRWNLPAPRLQGVRFQGPVARILTVDSPLRQKKTP